SPARASAARGGNGRRTGPRARTRSARGSRARGTSHGSRRRSRASPSDWTGRELVLASASGLAPIVAVWAWSPAGRAPHPAVARGAPGGRRKCLGLQEFQGLDVEQTGRVADDVGVAQRLQELVGAVELPHA